MLCGLSLLTLKIAIDHKLSMHCKTVYYDVGESGVESPDLTLKKNLFTYTHVIFPQRYCHLLAIVSHMWLYSKPKFATRKCISVKAIRKGLFTPQWGKKSRGVGKKSLLIFLSRKKIKQLFFVWKCHFMYQLYKIELKKL